MASDSAVPFRIVSVISGLVSSVGHECRRIVGVGSAAEMLALELEVVVTMKLESRNRACACKFADGEAADEEWFW